MPAQLIALDDGPSILLDKPILLLGRHPECDIQIDSRKISRRHCCVAQVNDYLVVRDLGSTNGLRINGKRVQEGRLADGDELTIGTTRYQVNWNADRDPLALRRQPSPKQVSPPPVEDDILESSDEPVPLPDPDCALLRMEDALDGVKNSPPPKDEPVVLPDQFELMPLSEVKVPVSAPPIVEPNSPMTTHEDESSEQRRI